MSVDLSSLPAPVQERLLRLQQLQQTLQAVLTQKQQVEFDLTEVNQALEELDKVSEDTVVFKSTGSLLVETKKPKVIVELNEKKEILNMRIDVLGKQEEKLRTQVKGLQTRLQQDLKPLTPS